MSSSEPAVLRVDGDLTIENAASVLERVKSASVPPGGSLVLDFSGAKSVDSFGAAALVEAWRHLSGEGSNLLFSGLGPETKRFLALVDFEGIASVAAKRPARPESALERIGTVALSFAAECRAFFELAADTFYWACVAPFRGRGLKTELVARQIVLAGIRAIPISCLIAFLVGLIMAMQSAHTLRQFGATNYIANMVGVSMTRELGPFLTAVVMASRSGSAITAELGTMRVTEEIDAMKTMGLSPYRFLVVPRVIALGLAAPGVTILFDVVGILGGAVVPILVLGVAPGTYFDQTVDALYLNDIVTGLVKSVAFGVEIALIACLTGFRIRGGAEGVGVATTRSVVRALVLIIATDLLFTAAFYFS
jgi:phospholipid/cholesterol/gamma-HCH transport system permease protein